MFGLGRSRGGSDTAQDTAPDSVSVSTETSTGARERVGGKGRPTPSRREQEQRNRRPLVGAGAVGPNATKEERKAARKARRAELNAERSKQRQAMFTGDERHLPPRDRGPARRWARDYVDARRGLGEYFLLFAFVALGMSLIRSPQAQILSTAFLWAVMASVAVESYVVRRRIDREVRERFGDDKVAGAATYGMLRGLQLRRTRLPRPQVSRGQFPE